MLLRDLLHSLRWFRAHPLFTISVAAILALGIGVNTAVFSVVDAVLLHPLPYESSAGLVLVHPFSAKRSNPALTAADYLAVAANKGAFRATAPLLRDNVVLTGAGDPDQLFALRDAGAMFPLLNVRARLGRALAEVDDRPDSARLAVLSDRLWARDFHSDPAVVGRTVDISGDPYTVVGVMPASFDFPAPEIDLWLSGHLTATSAGAVQIVAELRPGISATQASAGLGSIAADIRQRNGARDLGLNLEVIPWIQSTWNSPSSRQYRLTLIFLLAAVGLVLLIACADAGALLLSRAVERQREIAIRTSLGAGLWTVASQLLTESLVLVGIAGLAGVGLANGLLRMLTRELAALPIGLPHIERIALNGRALAFSGAACLLLAVLCSLAPVLFAFRIDFQLALRGAQGTRPKGSARLFSTFIAVQTGVAFLLLAGSGLMLRSLIRVQETDRGFQPEHVLTLRVPVGTMTQGSAKGKYDTRPRQAAYYKEILERMQRVPGVTAAAYVNNIPLSGALTTLSTEQGGTLTAARTISGQYFTAMGIPLVEGRFFTDSDTTQPVAIINQHLARQLFPDRDPLGQRMGPGNLAPTVVGVVKDSTQTHFDDPVAGEMYLPYQQLIFGPFLSTFVVRTAGDPLALADTLRREVWAVDPNQPVLKVETMEQVVSDSTWRPRFSAWVFSLLGGLALVLACVGVYSIIAYTAGLRAREVGIRVALGATPSRVICMVLGDALRPLLIGLALSVGAALLLARLLTGLLYETRPDDPISYFGATLVLLFAGLAACSRPAIKAAAADPVRALRMD